MRPFALMLYLAIYASSISRSCCFLVQLPGTEGVKALAPRQSHLVVLLSSTASSQNTAEPPQANAARYCIRQGMQAFRQGNVQESIVLFDQAEQYDPRVSPYLWQRGLSLYYAQRYKQASEQFQKDVSVNPADVEEIVWDIASLQQLENNAGIGTSTSFPPAGSLRLPNGVKDRRRIMSFVYDLFTGSGTEHQLAMAGTRGARSPATAQDEFYSLLYLGLYCEIRQEPYKAAAYMKRSLGTEYYNYGSSDYMTAIARVHCQLRGWS